MEVILKTYLPGILGGITLIGFISKYYLDRDKLRKELQEEIKSLKGEIRGEILELKKEELKSLKLEVTELSKSLSDLKNEFKGLEFSDNIQNDMIKSFNNNILSIIPQSIDESLKKLF